MQERTITYLTDACLITCILQKELAEDVLEAAKNCGAQGATISYAIGTGVRERMGLLGLAVDEQKEVIRIIVSKEQSELIFETPNYKVRIGEYKDINVASQSLEKIRRIYPGSFIIKLSDL